MTQLKFNFSLGCLGARTTGLGPRSTGLGPRSTGLGPRATGLGLRTTGLCPVKSRVSITVYL